MDILNLENSIKDTLKNISKKIHNLKELGYDSESILTEIEPEINLCMNQIKTLRDEE